MRNYFEEIKKMLLEDKEITKKIVDDINAFDYFNDYDISFYYLDFHSNDSNTFNYIFDRPSDAVDFVLSENYRSDDEYLRFDEFDELESVSEEDIPRLMEKHINEITEVFMKYYDTPISPDAPYYYLPEKLKEVIEEYLHEQYLIKKGIK